MKAPAKKVRSPRESLPYPYPLRECNPCDGQPWTIAEKKLRVLYTHCRKAPEFAEPDNAADVFICRADLALRHYRANRHIKHNFDPKVLEQLAEHAEGLATAIEQLNDVLDGRGQIRHRAALTALPASDDLHAVASAALFHAKVERALAGKGKRDKGELVQKQLLIAGLYSDYPTALQSTDLRSHFLESLRLILGRAATDKVRKALQMEVKRALAAAAEHDAARAAWRT